MISRELIVNCHNKLVLSSVWSCLSCHLICLMPQYCYYSRSSNTGTLLCTYVCTSATEGCSPDHGIHSARGGPCSQTPQTAPQKCPGSMCCRHETQEGITLRLHFTFRSSCKIALQLDGGTGHSQHDRYMWSCRNVQYCAKVGLIYH